MAGTAHPSRPGPGAGAPDPPAGEPGRAAHPPVPPPPGGALPGWVAAAVTFLCSGAVLVLEIVGLRLIAPYVGVTLQTSTAVIGFALAAIALGAYTGGLTADRTDPRRLIASLMVGGGALVVAVLPLVRFTGSLLTGTDAGGVLLLAAVAVVVPAALLSAVPPMVVKLQLATLTETGSVVGRLSGIGTLGGIAATFATGFLLVAVLPSSVILVATGLLTVAAGAAVGVLLRRRAGAGTGRVPAHLLVLAVAGSLLAAVAPTPCEEETAYHCARVVADPGDDSGRVLVLDTLRHSYVDLDDPTHLEFEYVRAIAAAVRASAPAGEPLSALHVGGGGMTLPRYLADVRPGTQSRVLEVDPGVVAIDREQLGLATSDDLRVEVVDGRVGLGTEAPGGRDVVVGDAFGGLSVPWQLTTREAMELVDAALADDGVYAVNLIDHPPLDFVRAELATMRAVWPHVLLLARAPVLAGDDGGNLVAVASRSPLPAERLTATLPDFDLAWHVAEGAELDAFVGDARVLTDDFAPVDQLLTPYG
ncbi:fused MFS/spermidine synthase [Geodermatophilus sp. YIM 151500]|uniref:fused MFS/spermidine synthase n=1 Tax=Geodermatophilus sp. YIM 151500 TaxID=2984531 RepID=UPI0021E36185|nr:fused MFS/spermidine synthase [Geodermatophilus sp. YIM 151500]MCV2488706.1 fused MFS/spermidine synthase [Geodermatophilus sp. YIM 151500]